jgi:hypothetical protein
MEPLLLQGLSICVLFNSIEGSRSIGVWIMESRDGSGRSAL